MPRRLGYGQGDIAVEALVGTAFQARPDQMADAPVFIPHTRPERGPLWFAEPRTALLGAIPDTSAPAAARGVVEGVLFADRMIIESCIGEQTSEPSTSAALSASNPRCRNCSPTSLDRDILVVDESHLPAIGAAAMCVEVLDGHVVAPPPARRVQPRPEWRDIVAATLAAVPADLVDRHRDPAAEHPRRIRRNHCAPARPDTAETAEPRT